MLASGRKKTSVNFADSRAAVAASVYTIKQNQMIQPLKIVAFPKLSMEDGAPIVAVSPSSSLHGTTSTKQMANTAYQAHTLTNTFVGNR